MSSPYIPVLHRIPGIPGTLECLMLIADQSQTLCGRIFNDLHPPYVALPKVRLCTVCERVAAQAAGAREDGA